MATQNPTSTLKRADHPASEMSPADRAAHEAASHVRRPVPMPGRLLVEQDSALGLGPDVKPLADVRVDRTVFATGTITAFQPASGRVILTIADGDGNTATVIVRSATLMSASRSFGRIITVGDVVQVRGTVAHRVEHMPKTIDAFALRAVTA